MKGSKQRWLIKTETITREETQCFFSQWQLQAGRIRGQCIPDCVTSHRALQVQQKNCTWLGKGKKKIYIFSPQRIENPPRTTASGAGLSS
jgi:hypothetical protein